jgi:hypothetical protein
MRMVEQRNDDIFGCLSSDENEQLGLFLDRLIAHNQGKPGAEVPADDEAS